MRLENKVVSISRVGSGMGRALALLFGHEGTRVALVARKAAKEEVVLGAGTDENENP
jgi:NAD(P)-dependent dehydrogenase (short-subunit alcohol dehydrogenase family)